MKKTFYLTLSVLFSTIFLDASAQEDCDAIVKPRAVPGSSAFIYATEYYTMQTQPGTLVFNALTTEGAVAVVFLR